MSRPRGRVATLGPMSAPKCRDTDYIDFLIASPRAFTCTEAASVQPDACDPPAHDAFTRLLHRLEPDPEALWIEAGPLVAKAGGVLILDDSTLDKPYAKKMGLVGRHWSGKHKRVVWGINLISLVWSDGDRTLPVDYRVDDKPVANTDDLLFAVAALAPDSTARLKVQRGAQALEVSVKVADRTMSLTRAQR